MTDFTLHPVGYVSSPFQKPGDAPRQGRLTDELSRITLLPDYLAAADDLQAGDNIFIFCWFDRADRMVVKSRKGGDASVPLTGVFSSRSPNRPNPVALTLVKLVEKNGSVLTVKGLEAFDGTPVIDIKTYSAGIDTPRTD